MRTAGLAAAVALAALPAPASVTFSDGFESLAFHAGGAVEGWLNFSGIPGWRAGGGWNSGLRNATGTGRITASGPLAPPAGGTT